MATQNPDITKAAPSTEKAPLSLKDFVVWLYAGVLILHLPVLMIYFRELWEQPHYAQFFLFALAAAGVFIYMRLQTFTKVDIRTSSFWPNFFLVLSIPPIVAGNMIFDVNIIALGLFLVTTSFLGRICDRKTRISLMPAAWILLPIVRPPSDIDLDWITALQRFTSNRASEVLDVFGIAHNLLGNTIVMPGGGQFFVEEACSGVQSLFTLIFCGLAFAAFEKRNLFHTILLAVAAAFWAGYCNTIRVVAICVADGWGINLAEGFNHIMLGYACLAFGIAMLFCTDRLLSLIFGVRDPDDDSEPSLYQRIRKQFFPNLEEKTAAKKIKVNKTTSLFSRIAIAAVCGLIMIFALIPVFRLGIGTIASTIFTSGYNVEPVELSVIEKDFSVGEGAGKVEWQVADSKFEERDNNSVWGSTSNIWQIRSSLFDCNLSCDYPFFGYHELTVCYRGNGWKMESRKINRDFEDPFVEAVFTRKNGESLYLLYSHVNKSGDPVTIPFDDILRTNFVQRAINSFNRRFTREYGPQPQSFQIQISKRTGSEPSETRKQIMRELFAHSRSRIAQAIKANASQ